MSRRRRAIGFALLALACAGLAAAVAGGYRGGIEAQLGPLQPVLVARAEIAAREPLHPADARRLLEVRRVPSRFAPPDGLASSDEALGREAMTPIPAGAYVTVSQLRLPRDDTRRSDPGPAAGEAVEVVVTGADALAAGGSDPIGSRVDVVVTSEPRTAGPGRTYVAVKAARLLALREAGATEEPDPIGAAGAPPLVATLACSRAEALRLIQAHNYARELRLISAK